MFSEEQFVVVQHNLFAIFVVEHCAGVQVTVCDVVPLQVGQHLQHTAGYLQNFCKSEELIALFAGKHDFREWGFVEIQVEARALSLAEHFGEVGVVVPGFWEVRVAQFDVGVEIFQVGFNFCFYDCAFAVFHTK